MKSCNSQENQTTRRIPLMACVTVFIVVFAGALSQPARAQIAGELMLVNAKTGKCLTIAGGVSTENNIEAAQFDCDSDPSRRWTLRATTGDKIYQIKNVQTGKCLTIAGGVSTDNNVAALQFNCDTHPSRTWRISDVTGSGVYQIRNVQTNKCLTIAGGVSTANNVTALQFNCDTDMSRRWTIRQKL
ncbi:RICIN domain-containing protein [Variovorax sp. GT1P44]|uniref:RICIN domain-containing protein n=1 Tax=Variovorax sp. GT1P44 TaxID=3443742 RepID=UPI003F4883E9